MDSEERVTWREVEMGVGSDDVSTEGWQVLPDTRKIYRGDVSSPPRDENEANVTI